MCASARCSSGIRKLELLGPLGQPPSSGWRLQKLPAEAKSLQSAWDQHPRKPDNSESAQWDMLEFLTINGFRTPGLRDRIWDIALEQWCSPDPKRCPKGLRGQAAPRAEPHFFNWARPAWLELNASLPDGTDPELIPLIIEEQVAKLTKLVNPATNPQGCAACHLHWLQVLQQNPLPRPPTLDAVRHWVVDVHNLTREGRTPIPFETIAAKSNWH